MPQIHREALDKFRLHLEQRNLLRSPSGNYRHVYQSANVFVNFLETTGAVIVTDQISNQSPNLFLEFLQWMRIQRGTLDCTLKNYRLPIINLLESLGTDPTVFTAKNLRAFLIRQISCSSQEKSKNWGTAIRMFLRFLIAKGSCQPGLEYAIPTIARWRLSTMPKYLPAGDVEDLINSCDQTHLGIRDRAILLLLARLGLRASEVSGLKFNSIIWSDAALLVTGKNRCETRLPLPQDVGEAILSYLKYARPQASSDYVFMTVVAPWTPITRQVVGRAVVRAIRRTGISAPKHGSHLLRHSAATNMLREGMSLPAIGVLLRHASIETTTVYAKVDINLLKEVAMPWPEVLPC